MLAKIVKMKEKAFKKATELIGMLQNELNNYIKLQEPNSEVKQGDKYIGLNVIEVTNFIYKNNCFIEFLKYSFLGKYYQKKINLIKRLIMLIALIIGLLIYFAFGYGMVLIISIIVLIIILVIIFMMIKTGESYESFYKRTMLPFLLNIYKINFNLGNNSEPTDDKLKTIINSVYHKKTIKNNMDFDWNLSKGNIADLELIKITERRDKEGRIRKTSSKIFDGFYIRININNICNILRGNTIKIMADENVVSSIAEDTINGIYENKKEFLFNSEEMNKSFDCKISGHDGFDDIDDMMITIHKIITPSFEQHLLYLRERYNSFNMNISDDGMIATFNMERSLFQKIKHDELLDFKTTYREANAKFRMLKADLNGIEDFAYYNVFPFLERLYLIKYLTYLYLSYVDFENYYSVNNESINAFEEAMKNIYLMNNKEFKQIYTEKINEIKRDVKETIRFFEEEER